MPGGAHGQVHRLPASGRDRLGPQGHIHPCTIEFVLVRIIRVDLLDVKVHHIRAGVGEPPGNGPVVANHHARRTWEGEPRHLDRAGLRNRPAVQPDLVPDGWHLDAQVRIVGQQRHPAGGQGSGNRPRIGPDPCTGWTQQCIQGGGKPLHGGPIQVREVEPGGRGRLDLSHLRDDHRVVRRVRREEFRHLFRGKRLEQDGTLDLIVHITSQVPGHGLGPGKCVDRGPGFRFVIGGQDLQDAVFQADRRTLVVRQVGVHAISIGIQDGKRFWVIACQLLLGHLAPAQRAQEGVGFHLFAAEHLGEPSGTGVPPEVHLPETVLGMHKSLCHEQVVLGGGIDVRDAHVVTIDIHGTLQPRKLDVSFRLRERMAGRINAEYGKQDGHHRQPTHQPYEKTEPFSLHCCSNLGITAS